MERNKFTDGTWKADGLTITCYGAGKIAKCILPPDDGCFNAMGNAVLISKAPDLFRTVKELQEKLEVLINATPTGKRRNELTDLNMKTLHLIKSCNSL